MKYYLVSEQFAIENDGYTKDANVFRAFRVESLEYKDRFVVAEQALTDFANLFEGLELESVELNPNDFVPDYTPPDSNGKGIVIPEKFQWIFPCHVGGYTIELKEKEGVKYAEESCLGWTAFVREIRKPENRQYRSTIITVWNYGLYEAERIDL